MSGRNASCPHEGELIRATRRGVTDPALRAHCKSCEACSAAVLTMQYLAEESRRMERERAFPGPEFLLWRSRVRKRNALALRVVRPVAAMEKSIIILIVALALFFSVWQLVGSPANFPGAYLLEEMPCTAGLLISGILVAMFLSASIKLARSRVSR